MKNDNIVPKDWERNGLPGWAYFSDNLLDVENEELFRKHLNFCDAASGFLLMKPSSKTRRQHKRTFCLTSRAEKNPPRVSHKIEHV